MPFSGTPQLWAPVGTKTHRPKFRFFRSSGKDSLKVEWPGLTVFTELAAFTCMGNQSCALLWMTGQYLFVFFFLTFPLHEFFFFCH